jgi:hypothetical protein
LLSARAIDALAIVTATTTHAKSEWYFLLIAPSFDRDLFSNCNIYAASARAHELVNQAYGRHAPNGENHWTVELNGSRPVIIRSA